MVAVLLAFTVIGTIAMPWLVWAMASGFVGERFDLAVQFGRISFSYILFISLVALLSGVLTTHGQFSEASFVPVTGVAQLAFTWVSARRLGYRFGIGLPRLTPELRRLAVIAGPAVLAGGVVQVNMLVGRQVASFTEGAVAWLSYADRLYQLPLGVVGIAIGTVLLPELSRRLRAGDAAGGGAV
jgi:putative peptidoglycan lipid II flippase